MRIFIILLAIIAIAYSSYLILNPVAQQAAGQAYHHLDNGTFRNPEGSIKRNIKVSSFSKFFWNRIAGNRSKFSIPPNHVLNETAALTQLEQTKGDTITWLGHASFLIRLQHKTILTDPYLSELAGLWGIGPRRYVPPGISIKHLPPLDFIILSHNHYDSLDLQTINQLANKNHIKVITPLNTGKYFKANGYKNIYELDWQQSISFNDIRFTAMPAIHFSRRGLFDGDTTLWAGFTVKTPQQNIYFSGDTAYGAIFKNIIAKYGPFNLAILGIGAYLPQDIMRYSHSTPEQAVQIGKDVAALNILGMHWGTIILSEEPPFEPPKRFKRAAKQAGFLPENIWLMKIGETRAL